MASLLTDSEALAVQGATPTTDTFNSLSAIEAVDQNPIHAIAEEDRRIRRLRAGFCVIVEMLKVVCGCLLFFIGGLLYLALAILLLAAVIVSQPLVLMIVINLTFKAVNGAISFFIGNAILRGALHMHYTTNTLAAAIGAIGGVFSAFIFGIVSLCIPKDENGELWWPFNLVRSVAVATLSGTIGCAILQKYHVDCHGINILHATGAGALGGVILGPGLYVAMPFILPVLFSPLLIAMKLGFRWAYVRSNESWSETGAHRFWYFYTYGTSGRDPDIQEEVAGLEHRRQIPQQYRAEVQQPYRAYGNSSWLL